MMMSGDETVSTAFLAEDAAVSHALHRHADAVADGARRGVTEAVPGQLITMSRAEADRYAAAAAPGAVAATLAALDNCLAGNVGTSRVKQDETTMVPALTRAHVGTKTASWGNISFVKHSVLAFSAMMAVVSVFVIVLRAV